MRDSEPDASHDHVAEGRRQRAGPRNPVPGGIGGEFECAERIAECVRIGHQTRKRHVLHVGAGLMKLPPASGADQEREKHDRERQPGPVQLPKKMLLEIAGSFTQRRPIEQPGDDEAECAQDEQRDWEPKRRHVEPSVRRERSKTGNRPGAARRSETHRRRSPHRSRPGSRGGDRRRSRALWCACRQVRY